MIEVTRCIDSNLRGGKKVKRSNHQKNAMIKDEEDDLAVSIAFTERRRLQQLRCDRGDEIFGIERYFAKQSKRKGGK